MPPTVDKAELLARLEPMMNAAGMARVYPETPDRTAHTASLALAGLPHYDDLWAGDMGNVIALVAVASGARLTGFELARRADLLSKRVAAMKDRVKGPVQALQLVVYERPVPTEERQYVLENARKAPVLPLQRPRVATWVFALDELALHSTRFPGWPPQLAAAELRKLLFSPAA
ncbi:MAG TPA: hypothetical protein VG496_20050 [Myxococcales bacterium]|nr:hypothetical protein [Myxococcales bacterium]